MNSVLSFGDGLCGEEVVDSEASPGGKYIAEVFRRNCGATTGFATHVNVRPSTSQFKVDRSGIIQEGLVYLSSDEIAVNLRWKSAAELVVEHGRGKALVRNPSWRGIAVSYAPLREPGGSR